MTRRRTTLAWLAWAATVPVSGCAHAGAYEDFFKAIELDNGAAISDLLKRGFDPNARDPKGQPALVVALREDSRKAAAALIGARGLKVEERKVSIEEWKDGVASGEIAEAFACGTAAVVTPIGQLKGKDFAVGDINAPAGEVTMAIRKELTDIQYGRLPDRHGWLVRLR